MWNMWGVWVGVDGLIGHIPWDIGYRSEKFGLVSLGDSYVGFRSTSSTVLLGTYRGALVIDLSSLDWYRWMTAMLDSEAHPPQFYWRHTVGHWL